MKKLIKGSKGISLISLVITVAVILILTNVIIYNAADNLRNTKLSNMQADIENLRDRVSTYYVQYGKIPADTKIEYTNVNSIDSISEDVDTGNFYVIDLSAMENVTLNYGRDYERIRTGEVTTQEDINQLTDIYIINENSHNVFYVNGIDYNGRKYYTDYSAEAADTAIVNIRYYDGVEIPDGFYYVGGTKETGIVISDVQGDDLDNSKQGNQFVWIPVEDGKNYVRNTSYEDVNVSTTAYTDTGYLPNDLQPTIPDGTGEQDAGKYNEEAERQAVINAGGFFVSRFEAGKEGTNTLVSKKGETVWTNISQEASKTTAKNFKNTESVKSALCSGIQWDMVMDFVDGKEDGNGNSFNVAETDVNRHTGEGVSGKNESDKVCNIYDLEGNYVEYISEKNTFNVERPFNQRGGSGDSENISASSNRYYNNGAASPIHTFRFVLYVIPRDNWTPTYDETTTYTDRNGDTATIPQGFSVSRRPNERTINDGLVVKASDGSEFVWIPVATVISDTEAEATQNKAMAIKSGNNYKGLLYNFTGTTSTVISGCTTTMDSYREPDLLASYDNNTSYNTGLFSKDTLQQEYNNMIESVDKYKGFYVGRYELGLEGTTAVSKKSDSSVTTANSNHTNTNLWYGLYSKCKSFSEESGKVVSSMMWGSQYDAMMNWMLKQGENITEANAIRTNTLEGTGSNQLDVIKNIFDLYGCHYEWTLEANSDSNRIYRTGYYDNTTNSLIYRGNDTYPVDNSTYYGSRITLYVVD